MYADDIAADRLNRDEALVDLRMIAGDQWDNDIGESRPDSLPKLTVNFLDTLADAVAADFRTNPIAVKYHPVGEGADEDLADIRNGLYRAIHRLSHGDHVYAHAFASMVSCGIGHMRVFADYPPAARTFDQELFLEPIYNPLAVVWDHNAVKITREDAGHCFVIERMAKKALEGFMGKYDLRPSDFDYNHLVQGTPEWVDGNGVVVAELHHKDEREIEIGQTFDGQIVDLSELTRVQKQFLGIERTRKVKRPKVNTHIVVGNEILDTTEWVTPDIPVIPFVGKETHVGAERRRRGALRNARDIQILRNLMRSYQLEMFAKMVKEPGFIGAKAAKGFEALYKGFRFYNDEAGATPPRINSETAAIIQTFQQVQQIDQEFRNVTGVMEAKLGERSNEQSGKAIDARVAQTDALNAVFMDNARVSIAHVGKVISDALPAIYTGERVARIVGEDEGQEMVTVNKRVVIDGEEIVVNDLSAGRYDSYAASGPSFATQKTEDRTVLLEAINRVPQLAALMPDHILEALGLPEEVVERGKRSVPPELLGDGQASAAPALAQPVA